MTTRYVGPGGNNSNNGLSWENRKLTLNGVEATPVTPGDRINIAPGVYPEEFVCNVSGSSGNPITYVGDVTGEHTDGIGGAVRITGSDNNIAYTRNNIITCNGKSYRTFSNLQLDGAAQVALNILGASNNIIAEYLTFLPPDGSYAQIYTGDSTAVTIRNSIFYGGRGNCIHSFGSASVNNAGNLAESCLFVAGSRGLLTDRVGGWVVKNCTFVGLNEGVRVSTALAAGQTLSVYNSIFMTVATAFRGTATAEVVEDYNYLSAVTTGYNTVTAGANTIARPALFSPPMLAAGIRFDSNMFELGEWCTVAAATGNGPAAADLYGVTRPTTNSKNSWGAFQFAPVQRATTQTQGGSAASVKISDAGAQQIFVPVSGAQITVSVYVYREADYAGSNPQMIIRQPGQSDRTTTDGGSASTFNQLSDTFTPAAQPPYVVVELRSRNTATSGSYAVYFDTLEVA
jgi:hypothetical protein